MGLRERDQAGLRFRDVHRVGAGSDHRRNLPDPFDSGWRLRLDNDLLPLSERDGRRQEKQGNQETAAHTHLLKTAVGKRLPLESGLERMDSTSQGGLKIRYRGRSLWGGSSDEKCNTTRAMMRNNKAFKADASIPFTCVLLA
jgi:hypothetical protein